MNLTQQRESLEAVVSVQQQRIAALERKMNEFQALNLRKNAMMNEGENISTKEGRINKHTAELTEEESVLTAKPSNQTAKSSTFWRRPMPPYRLI